MTSTLQRDNPVQRARLKAHVDKIKAQVHEAKAKLDLSEAAAQKQKAQAEIAVIGDVKTAIDTLATKITSHSTTRS
jgi:precorrin isomerase